MRSVHLSLLVVIVLVALFGSALWVLAQSVPPDPAQPAPAQPVEASAIQAVGLRITATVGTIAGECATTSTIQVRAGTTVYYCFTVHHTGVAGDEALTIHNVRTSRGVDRELQSFTVNPGQDQIRNTVVAGFVFTDVTNVDVTNFITWTARPADNEPQVIAYSSARIDVVNPSLNVVKSVGLNPNSCASDRALRVPNGQTAYFCITLQNTGDITFTSHTLTDQQLSIINATFVYTLPPGNNLSIIPSNLTTIIPGVSTTALNRVINGAFSNDVSVTSRTRSDLTATGASTATVDIGTTTVRFTKTLSTQPEECSTNITLQIPEGTRLYYCATIENTGGVVLNTHRLTEQFLSIDVTFRYPLAPGETLRVTNGFLASINQPVVFGPFEIHPRFGNVVNNSMFYEGTSDEGFGVKVSAPSSTTYSPTPTATSTSRPSNTSTPPPAPTNTPTITPFPESPTPTLTPTFTPETPTATPTISYAIISLETPTPRTQVAGVPQDPTQQSTAEPNQPPSQAPEQQQLPVQDPVVATATQIAVDATTTAVVAEATAAQLAIENAAAAATALAEAQAPVADSPLPTPTFGPTLDASTSQDGSVADLPVAPGVEIPTETPTATPPAPLPDSPLPGADITVLPPLITAEVAPKTPTETPAVVVLVVTNTPAPGEEATGALPEGQRPIIYPTPTATADFIMAAARTFDIAVTTFGWLWFLVGSLIFFVTAGIVAGLFFRQSEASRFEIPEPDYWLEEEPSADRLRTSSRSGQSAEDEWPAELP